MPRILDTPGARPSPLVANLSELGGLVRQRRLELRLRIDDAARGCGVAVNVLSRLENGNSIGADRLLKVLSGLGLAMIVTGEEESLRFRSGESSSGWDPGSGNVRGRR